MDGEGIGELCRRGGWTYAVLWRIDRRDPRLLVLEESYHEEKNGRIFEKMINQVHVIGQGIIGEVAISGKHQWINFDAQCMESSEISTSVKSDMFKERGEWQHQICAGIKTVAVISLPPLGVILFGSTQKICESSDFVARAQHLLRRLGIRGLGYNHVDWSFTRPQETFAAVISSLGSSSSFKNNIWRDSACIQRQDSHLSSEYSSPASGLLSMGSQTHSPKPYVSSIPVASTSSSFFNGFHSLFHETPFINSSSAHKFTNQQESSSETQILLPPSSIGLHSHFKSSSNLFAAYFKSNTRAKEIGSFSYMEHKPGVFCEDATLLHGRVGPKEMLSRVQSLDDTGKLQELRHCSSPPASSVCGLFTGKSSLKTSPLTPELPENFLTSPPDSHPENSPLAHSTDQHIHDEPLNNHINSTQQTDNQVNNGLACSMAAEFPNSQSECPSVCASSFLDRGGNWHDSTSHASSTQLVSDNDLFDGMELDLAPMILRQDCWDDILLPIAGINGASELELGSVTQFSDSSLEQLLDAVVAGNSNMSSSSCNSVRTKTNVSSASQDSTHQLPTKISEARADHLPVPDLSSLIHPPAASLPEWNSERMMPGSPKSAKTNPNLRAWIDGGFISVNAESSAFHPPKKTEEESVKTVRKRARPCESTRPRPKDRQQIQDRVKELREIVPNSAKCSIDALLDRTIRHLLFLQSVTKYADKLKQVDEQKMIGEESGVVLRDNTNGGVGGATWAYEVAGQTMVCPILIEDLHPSGQMLVEMLCEERGFFLEIADVVRGFGLTILKGVMENRGRKVWARFIVEANRDVTRMDIFLSLVQLLQQTSSSIRSCEPRARVIDTPLMTTTYQQSIAAIPIGLADRLH